MKGVVTMIFFVCLIFGGLFLTWLVEETPWEEELEIRQLIRQSYENARKRQRHRCNLAYYQCGWKPPKTKRTRRRIK